MSDRNQPVIQSKKTPVYLLSGFLGSGKTTFLTSLLARLKAEGKRPAVIMNELGDINLDGELISRDVPMAEMLGGCICCSIRGDLGVEIASLIGEHHPDAIIIESTGAANPMETLDGVADAAMYASLELRSVVTIVDGPELLERRKLGKGRTYKLMVEQIRCATLLMLNKTDKLAPDQLVEAQQLLRELNAHAAIMPAVRCVINDWEWLDETAVRETEDRQELGGHGEQLEHHHSHGHVMAYTHYFDGPVHSESFEALLQQLPGSIYRAKGVVSFSDMSSGSRYLFQYAYKESDFIRIEPQGHVNDVAVFIGEHFSKEELLKMIKELQAKS
ncbi:GTP-binding protein [Paenibacillus sp. 1011MAR3C5]|uniref:CobW family GTP-binding protein n=1 Tax=Paenibacillus sp. 1011MAR3C5 TaxID=1675787 RepID=UPI000E6CA288|nr:GTP-binding protein [Paenibacillus sp. 1011MAR3C5]RJE87697.1 GTP-binding protein [Paenibacillus sp. 1011MAR3C5]